MQSNKISDDGKYIGLVVDEYIPPYKDSMTNKQKDARMDRFVVIFKAYFIKFIRNNFTKGSLVKIKGRMTHDDKGELKIYGDTINLTRNSINLTRLDKQVRYSQQNERAPFDEQLQDHLTSDF